MQAAIDELTALNTSTESEFLALGGRLQGFYVRSGEISRISSSIAARLSGGEISGAIERLQGILDRVNRLESKSRQGTEILTSLLDVFDGVCTQLLQFAKIVKNLHVLCNFIKIESARIGKDDGGFSTLAEDIRTLAANIDAKSVYLLERAHSVSRLVRENMAVMTGFEDRQRGQAHLIVEGTMKNLAALTEQHDLSLAALNDLSNRWNLISRGIGEVVASIQFHDITRQQIEHVCEALSDLMAKLTASGIEKRGRNLAARLKPLSGGNGTPVIAVTTCKLQSAQLHHSSDDLVSAVTRIKENLRDVASHAGKMSADTRKVTGMGDQTGPSFLSELERDLSSLTTLFSDYTRLSRDLAAAMGQLADTVCDMSSLVKEVEGIGTSMKMVALNSCIYAAHMGDDGMALGVLADSVHQLSIHTTQQINTVADELRTVITTADRITNHAQIETEKEKEAEDQVDRHLNEMVKPLRQMDEEIISLLSRAEESGKTFLSDIENTVDGISVHDRMERTIQNVRSELEALINDIRTAFPTAAEHHGSEGLEELKEIYTMHKEREIHESLLLSHASTSGGAMTDGAGPTEKQPDDVKEREGEDLGDNVELF